MSIHKVKRGNRVYLAEYKSLRIGKRVKSIFVRYLGPEDKISSGVKAKRRTLDRLELRESWRAGDIRLLWHIAHDLDFAGTIDRVCCQQSPISGPSPGKFITAWAINRVIDPESCTQLERWIPTTDLPSLMNLPPETFTKDAFLSSLDFICYYDRATQQIVDHTSTIDDVLYQQWRRQHPLPGNKMETVAYDITSVLFFGVSCPLAELSYNPKRIKQRQVNLGLIVSKWDRYPLGYFIYNGSLHPSATVPTLMTRLIGSSLQPGTLIWDRGNVSAKHIQMVESSGWKLITSVPRTSKDARAILDNTDVPLSPKTFVHQSKVGHIYAVKTEGSLFGRKRTVVVYVNQDMRSREINAQNLSLAEIPEQLDVLNKIGRDWTEKKLHEEIDKIVGTWKDCIEVHVKRKEEGSRVEWRYKTREIASGERAYGKYILLSTDASLSAREIVRAYFEKDFIEKVFRTLKTNEEIQPVRHRLEPRVHAYMFVCVLAYRLIAALRNIFVEKIGEEKAWERMFELLQNLTRIQRVEVKFGNEIKTYYLNMTNSIEDTLKRLQMKNLFKEEVRLVM